MSRIDLIICCFLTILANVKCDPISQYEWNPMENCLQKINWKPVGRQGFSNDEQTFLREASDVTVLFRGSVRLSHIKSAGTNADRFTGLDGIEITPTFMEVGSAPTSTISLTLNADKSKIANKKPELIIVKILPGRARASTLCYTTVSPKLSPTVLNDWKDGYLKVMEESKEALKSEYIDDNGNLSFEIMMYKHSAGHLIDAKKQDQPPQLYILPATKTSF